MALQSRATDVSVTWVKGHAKLIDVVRGRTTEEDKRGNDGADALAVAGAALHQVSPEVVAAANLRTHTALHVQQMMVAILKARFLAEGQTPNDAEGPDRGSEMGDCIHDDHTLDDGLERSDTELLHASGTELVCHEFLNDECDEGAGTCHGVAQ